MNTVNKHDSSVTGSNKDDCYRHKPHMTEIYDATEKWVKIEGQMSVMQYTHGAVLVISSVQYVLTSKNSI